MRISNVTRFLTSAALVLGIAYGLFLKANRYFDPFGIFHTTRDNEKRVYWNERYSKYMFALNYMQHNFETLLVGASVADSLPVEVALPQERIYDASLDGANICELLPLVEMSTRSRNIKSIYLCVDPYETKNSDFKSALRPETVVRETAGSVNTLRVYAWEMIDWIRHKPSLCTAQGNIDEAYGSPTTDWWARRDTLLDALATTNRDGFPIDPKAGAQLAQLGQICHERGISLHPFLSPEPTFKYQRLSSAYASYKAWASACLKEPTIYDLNLSSDSEVVKLLADPTTFVDGSHPNAAAARRIWLKIWQALKPSPPESEAKP